MNRNISIYIYETYYSIKIASIVSYAKEKKNTRICSLASD